MQTEQSSEPLSSMAALEGQDGVGPIQPHHAFGFGSGRPQRLHKLARQQNLLGIC